METINEEAKKEYDSFLASGDLKMLFPGMKGDWEKDKKTWITIWKANQRLINGNTKNTSNS